ncbi:hypothetical protein OIE68_14260 [Nocardia vinacea]|uniref:GNAT family N-acetyltransferase n=1 Tax=Nocardia vinacea TaxID=96468 RepID=A0ABZ1YV81_9NOCA|nr:hypothetical protein OIE68_14260 [Nocardia vinacea]
MGLGHLRQVLDLGYEVFEGGAVRARRMVTDVEERNTASATLMTRNGFLPRHR